VLACQGFAAMIHLAGGEGCTERRGRGSLTVLRLVQGSEDETLASPRPSGRPCSVRSSMQGVGPQGLTREEIKGRRHAGAYLNDSRPEVVALDT
jgi:hypothetical protein